MSNFEKIMARLSAAKEFGFRRLENGTLLIGHIPHIAPEAWFHQVYPGLTEVDLSHLEIVLLKREIPPTYKEFLRDTNGLKVFGLTLTFAGLRRSYERSGDQSRQPFAIETANYEKPKGAKDSDFFFGSYDWDGSKIYFDQERIVRCARNSATPLNQWPSFWEMLAAEIDRLERLFDKQGRILDNKMPTVPEAPKMD